jgi:REP element-mobilizing transposase RayT
MAFLILYYPDSMARTERTTQTSFCFRTRGGKRRGAGRKPAIPGRPGVSHAARPRLTGKQPIHVTLHVAAGVPNLRRNALYLPIMNALRAGMARTRFRLCHFAVLSNHLHLIVEAETARDLARGMQGLSSRLAKRVNQVLDRRGRFFSDRYHVHVLRSPTEVHHALAYVLLNQRRHEAERSGHRPAPAVDGWSSGAWFAGWSRTPPNAAVIRRSRPPPVVPAATWLLREGWLQGGPIRAA